MILRSVENVDAASISGVKYNASFFAAGFERRCVEAASKMDRQNLGRVIVSGFAEYSHSPSREVANQFFNGLSPDYFESNSSSDYSYIGLILKQVLATQGDINIFVDYSSMPRTWYGAILNYLRSANRGGRTVVDFCYVPGKYEVNLPVAEVQGISTVPGFEGVSGGSARTTAIFSLGFEKWTPYAALERVEPNEVVCVIAEPGANDKYAGRSREVNSEFFSDTGSEVYEFDIRDVSQTFGFLSEMAVLKLSTGCDVALVGMGPKPHALGMLLAAIRFPEIAVVHVRRKEKGPRDVAPHHYQIFTRVIFGGF